MWDFFVRAAPTQGLDVAFLDYATGLNLTNRMPLYIKPDRASSLGEVVGAMRSHFEGTPLQFSLDVGAEAYSNPYRWRPLTWSASDGNTYTNERSAATQQTGFNLVAQLRPDVPDPIKALMFFAVDDTASSVLTPIYGGLTRVPPSYGEGDLMAFDPTKAFWAFNLVVRAFIVGMAVRGECWMRGGSCLDDRTSLQIRTHRPLELSQSSVQFFLSCPLFPQANFAYARYSLIHPEIAALQAQIEKKHVALVQATDHAFVELWAAGEKDKAQALIDEVGVSGMGMGGGLSEERRLGPETAGPSELSLSPVYRIDRPTTTVG